MTFSSLPSSDSAVNPTRARNVYCSGLVTGTPHDQEASMKSIEIDRGKRLQAQPTTGHNRFTRASRRSSASTRARGRPADAATASTGQLGPSRRKADIASMEAGAIHP